MELRPYNHDGRKVGRFFPSKAKLCMFWRYLSGGAISTPLSPPPFTLVYTDHHVPCHTVHLPKVPPVLGHACHDTFTIITIAHRTDHHMLSMSDVTNLAVSWHRLLPKRMQCGEMSVLPPPPCLPPTIVLTHHCYLPKCGICLQNRADVGAHSHSPPPCWAKGAAWNSRGWQINAMKVQPFSLC